MYESHRGSLFRAETKFDLQIFSSAAHDNLMEFYIIMSSEDNCRIWDPKVMTNTKGAPNVII